MNKQRLFQYGGLIAAVALIALVGAKNASTSFSFSKPYTESEGPGPTRVYVEGGSFLMGGSLRDDITYTNDVQQRIVSVGSFMMDQHEVTNGDWKEYLEDTGNNPAALPDSTLIWSSLTYNEPIIDQYFSHGAYNDYPVVGVTWEQANAYAEWRTQKIREITGNPNTPPFRLPTEAEWEYAAISLYGDNLIGEQGPYNEGVAYGKIYPWNGMGVRETQKKSTHGMLLANFRINGGVGQGANNGGNPPTTPVMSFWPNDFYLFDMAGNVNEWVSDNYTSQTERIEDDNYLPMRRTAANSVEGQAESSNNFNNYGTTSLVNEKSRIYKGGSWNDRAHWLNPATKRHFQQDQASTMIGFRTVMTSNIEGKSIPGIKKPKVKNRKPIPPSRARN